MRADLNSILSSTKPVLVDFYTEWCQPCQILIPVLHEIVRDLGDRIKVIKIDIEKNREVSHMYGVGQLPTLMLFKNGKLKWRNTGLISRAGLMEVIFQKSWAEMV